jgi:uncharacterized protein YyaL (SSP411 family)
MPNHLISETSPYLLQHADNPVDWYPWGEEALSLAQKLNKPILLSIGYAACHWCHVMAHESFEDKEIADVMNELFINIKVDREERPDLDQIYQTAQYMLTQRNGGWPLTMFLTPDQKPFFGGTYFPKTARYNLPGFAELLKSIADAYRTQGAEIEKQNEGLVEALKQNVPVKNPQSITFDDAPLELAIEDLKKSFDEDYGGFGSAPKFPHPTEIEFCLHRFAASKNNDVLNMALKTLERMAKGGIYDQLGGGFCRYSVDQYWMIPHFEKMLYDNALLLPLYADAWVITQNPLFKQICEETAAWVMREMQSPEGGYYSSIDADSEHEEGKFYVWDKKEIQALLDEEEYAVAVPYYGLDHRTNFEDKHWHLYVAKDIARVSAQLNLTEARAFELLQSARAKLFRAREKRIRPGRDEKVLTSWSALMIKGMAHAALIFNQPEWLNSARRCLQFIGAHLWKDTRLLATYKDGKAHLNAYLDDYAFLLDAALNLLEADFKNEDLTFAQQIADALITHFEDTEQGGFFFTSHDHEALIQKPKPGHDNATPSGNGMAIRNLQRLGHLIGKLKYLEAAERCLQLYYLLFARRPGGFAAMLMGLEETLAAPNIILLRGPQPVMQQWQQEIARFYLPHTIVIRLSAQSGALPQAMDKPVTEHISAWVCQGTSCLPPITDLPILLKTCEAQ